jgi:hypothetical protein
MENIRENLKSFGKMADGVQMSEGVHGVYPCVLPVVLPGVYPVYPGIYPVYPGIYPVSWCPDVLMTWCPDDLVS